MVSRWVLYFLAIKTLVRFFAINLRVHSRLHSGAIQVGMVRLRRYCSQQAEQARNSQYSQVIWLRRTERQIIHSDILDVGSGWWLLVIVYVYVFISIFLQCVLSYRVICVDVLDFERLDFCNDDFDTDDFFVFLLIFLFLTPPDEPNNITRFDSYVSSYIFMRLYINK